MAGISGKNLRIGLVHGFIDRPSVWARTVGLFPDGWVVDAPELPWGHSAAPPGGSALPLMERFGGSLPPIVVAHSRGAYETLRETTATGGGGVSLLVLVGWANQSSSHMDELAPAGSDALARMCRDFVTRRFDVEGRLPAGPGFEWLVRFAARRFGQWDRTVRLPPEALSSVSCPTLLLAGEHDWTLEAGQVRALARTLPDAEVAVLEGCGHWPMLEDPGELVDQVLAFLARRTTPDGPA